MTLPSTSDMATFWQWTCIKHCNTEFSDIITWCCACAWPHGHHSYLRTHMQCTKKMIASTTIRVYSAASHWPTGRTRRRTQRTTRSRRFSRCPKAGKRSSQAADAEIRCSSSKERLCRHDHYPAPKPVSETMRPPPATHMKEEEEMMTMMSLNVIVRRYPEESLVRGLPRQSSSAAKYTCTEPVYGCV